MDKRKIKSRNILHKQLYSSTQLTAKTVTKESSIPRSVSAAGGLPAAARKRKNSEIEENSSSSSSPTTPQYSKKRKCNVAEKRSDESSEEDVASPKHSTLVSESRNIRNDKFAKRKVFCESSTAKRIFTRSNFTKEQSDESSEGEMSSPSRLTLVSSSGGARDDKFSKPSASYESSSSKRITKRHNVIEQKNDESSEEEVSSPKHPTLLSRSQATRDENFTKPSASYKSNYKKRITKRSKIREQQSDDSSEEEISSPKHPAIDSSSRSIRNDKFAKPSSSYESNAVKRISKNKKQSNASKGSYIRGVLEALDKSPSKLSQSSNSSVDKYRKINLRSPMRSRLQKPVSRIGTARKDDKISNIENKRKSDNHVENVSVKSVTNKRCISNLSSGSDISHKGNEEETSHSDTDSSSVNGISTQDKNKKIQTTSTPLREKNSHVKSQVIATIEQGNKTLELPELSPLKGLHSPEKNNANLRKKTSHENDSKIVNFLNSVGITLCSGDNLHTVDCHPREIIVKMKALLNSDDINMEELLVSWHNYIDNEENLTKSLLELKIETDEGTTICTKAMSLSKLLLHVPQLHIQVLNSLFKKLIDAVITTDSSDDVPWASAMLQQFRFLELLVDPDLLISLMEELLNSSPEWFQREVIIFIPDIITDSQHSAISELLFNILLKNNDLTSIILECVSNLGLTEDYRENFRAEILKLLETNLEKSAVPSITKFILTDCSTEEIALKSLKVLRKIDLCPSSKETIEELFTNQMFMVNVIKTSIKLFKEVAQAALTLIKTTSEPKPLDVILSLILCETIITKKKVVETVFSNHVKDGYYKKGLMYMFYSNYKEVAKKFQTTALNFAFNFLQTDSSLHIEFGIEWLRNIFTSQSDASYKQREIMEKLLNLMGCKERIVQNVLEVLCRMANDDVERQYLQNHAGFLRSFVDKIDNLQFNEVAKLYHLLHGLCTQSELISNILNDDLSIIMQKQLCSPKVITKCKGVLGAVMAIKHLASNSETSDQAFELLKKTVISLKNCTKSQALFYDQLGEILVSINTINKSFLSSIANYFEDIFINSCLVDENTDENLVPKFGLNDTSMAEKYYVHFGGGKLGFIVPALFKLLRICNLQLSDSLESINAVLGCPVLMPEDFDVPEPSTADYIIYCINWFRELISGFVTQKESLLKEQVLKRLDCLMTLQSEFVTMASMCGTQYKPPHCYFHYFPAPQFSKPDIKIGKKGGKKKNKKENKEKDANSSSLNTSLMLPEWENWQVGSAITIKNPAFFRKMDPKIIYLLDINKDLSSQASSASINIAQVCFIIKDIFGMLENQVSENLVRDLIQLLPKICNKLKTIISNLREKDNPHEKEAVKLFLCFITTLFSWKEFYNAKHNNLLRDGLRTLAGMENESNALLRSCKDLVAEAYKYFESLSDIATQMSLAVALVNICSCLMKHSTSFTEQSKANQAKMAYGFLCLDWSTENNRAQYNAAVKELLKIWIDNEPDPLKTVTSILEWLPEEAAKLEKLQSPLPRLPSIKKINLYLLVKQLFIGLIKGLELSLSNATRDPERIQIWLDVATNLDKFASICRVNKNNVYLIFFLRYMTLVYQTILVSGMPVLEINMKYQTEEVLNVIKLFQKSGRFLRDIFCTARRDNNVSLLKLIPAAKAKREKFIYRVKGLLAANDSIGAFWMGNLINKDLDGEQIVSQSTQDITEDESDLTAQTNDADEAAESEVFNSDSDNSSEVESE